MMSTAWAGVASGGVRANEEAKVDLRNRIGLYGAYFLGMAGIGFTLPFLPVYLAEQGLSKGAIGLVSTVAALASLAQFPLGMWSDRLGRRKPFLVVALAVLAAATALLGSARGAVWLSVLAILFAENGPCRATVESLAGAEAVRLAAPGQVGAALGALRFWKPVSIVLVALAGGMIAQRYGVGAVLPWLAVEQALAVGAALLIHENGAERTPGSEAEPRPGGGLNDRTLWVFAVAMVLFHAANAPGGVYLGLFLQNDLGASRAVLSYAFVVSMIVWMLVVRPAGRWADRIGRRPLLLAGWAVMALRLALVAAASEPWQVLIIQVLDGLANGLFAVLAAAWVTDRLADPRRVGEAQVLVGSCLVLGSAVGPLLAGLIVEPLGYRTTFALLAGVGAAATLLVVARVPEALPARRRPAPGPLAATSEL
jgi:MFS family permease